MANTAIRLGYLSISSGGGGGAGFEEYANLAAFPPVGEDDTIYLALDTKKIYSWIGSSYAELSPSEVTSVNTQTGDVVLDKSDIGLGNVDNTSDADKPISDDTQDALDDLDERIVPIEERDEVTTVYAYENNAQVYADGEPGIKDPSALIRDGWYFKNSIAGQKINWYYFDGLNQGTCTLGDFKSAYAVMTFDAVSGAAAPIIAVYTIPTGTGDAIPGFAHSRIIYDGTMIPTPVVGKQYLVYAGENPPVHPNLPRINLPIIPSLSIGDKLPAEQILTISFGSATGAGVNQVQFMVETLGLFSDPVKHELDLRIRTVPLNSASKIDAIYLPSYVDDVLEYANLAAFPATGETGKIYVALDTNKIYRWSGSAYVEISPGAIPPVTSVNTKTGDVVLDKADIGLGNVDNTSDADKPISDDTQDALDLKYDASNPAGYITAAEVPESPVLSVNQQVGDVFLDKYDIGLENVDNTSDADKPISDDTQDALDDKANTNLDNLVATAIPEGVNLESVSTSNFAIRTKDQPTGNSGNITIETGSTTDSRGSIQLDGRVVSADVDVNFKVTTPSAASEVWIGNTSYGQLGGPYLYASSLANNRTFEIGGQGLSDQNPGLTELHGAAIISSIDGSYVSGEIDIYTKIQTGTNATNASYSSGDINIYSGDADVYGTGFPDANTGNVNISTGTPQGSGTRGIITLDGDYITVNFNQIKNVANGTDSNDAVNVSQLSAILDYTPADTSAWIAPVPDDVKEALDQLADRLDSGTGVTITAFEDMKEPTGFLNRTDSTISFDDSTRIFTIAPVGSSFSFYIKGNKFTKTTAQTVTIPDSSGSHYIYFNTSGVLVSTQVFDISIIEQDAYVSLVYWNTDTIPHSRSYFAEERHGITMDGTTHAYLHTIFGARYLSGLALGGFTIGNGSLDSHAQFTSDSGSIRDEDILHVIGAQTQIPILFRQGQLWRKKAADNFPVIYSGSAGYTGANGRLPYNQYTGGAWQLTQVASNKFVLVHYFATNDVDNKVVGIQGIAEYNDIPAARNAASTEITTLSDLPFTEFVPIGTVIFQTNTYTNAIDARIVPVNGANYVDFRGTQLYTPAGEATEHSLLSGLADDDHIQYHTDARGDARYNLKSTGDISETSYSITNSQTSAHNITGFAFDNAIVRSFEAEVSVKIDADADLFEKLSISGIQKGSDWEIAVRSLGDSSGIVFSITSAGQLQYTSLNYTGFVSGIIKFRAITTSV